jgi:uncharacterized protein YciI
MHTTEGVTVATFAVRYTYTDDPASRDEFRPEHREFLRGLNEEGYLIASGPFTDGDAGALLLIEAAGSAAVERLLDQDPFQREGVIAEREVRGWDVVIGNLAPPAGA